MAIASATDGHLRYPTIPSARRSTPAMAERPSGTQDAAGLSTAHEGDRSCDRRHYLAGSMRVVSAVRWRPSSAAPSAETRSARVAQDQGRLKLFEQA